MSGVVEALGVAAAAGAPIEPRERVHVAVARGVLGDRYAEDRGHFKGFPDQEVTLAEAEDAEAAGIAPLAMRRNVVTRGLRLEDLIGRTFRVGDALLHGVRPCLPCRYLEGVTQRPGLKAAVRGGLRARVVAAGEVRVGARVEPVRVVLDDDMRAVVESAHLAFVATVRPDGLPNLSPKGTIRVLDEHRLAFLDLASPQTRKDIEASPWMEINVVDTTSRRGYRFLGRASAHVGDETHRSFAARVAAEEGVAYADRGVVVLEVERALPLVSPGYQKVEDEHAMRAAWRPRRVALDAAFEAHVARRGAFRW